MTKQNKSKEFLNNYQAEEIKPDVFKILFDLDTKEAGADYAIIDKTHINIVCDDYEISQSHNLDSQNLNQRIMYALRRKEENTRIIRQILKHLAELRPIIDSIFFYLRE